MIMNKKDVLGAHPAAGIIQKMKSMPHPIQCRKCSKYDTQQGKGKAGFLAVSSIWKQEQQKLKSFNYFNSILHVAGCFFCSLIIDTLPGVSYLIYYSIYRLYIFDIPFFFPYKVIILYFILIPAKNTHDLPKYNF